MTLARLIELTADGFEAAGAGVMAVGVFVALAKAVRDGRTGQRHTYRSFRARLGRAIVLGLELLVAADILRTIVTAPTLSNVAVLGLIVLIRTFLTMSLEAELDGRWPWQKTVPPERSNAP